MKEFWADAGYHFSQIWAGWTIKAPLSVLAGFYSGFLNGDWFMFITFCCMTFLDVMLGSWLAVKRRRFDPRLFGKWVVKVLVHFAVIFIVGVCIRSILVPIGSHFPLLDLFLGLLICTEGLSVLKNMRRLGMSVPRLATRILTGVQDKAEKKATDFFSQPENDRRRAPMPEPCGEPGGKAYDDQD